MYDAELLLKIDLLAINKQGCLLWPDGIEIPYVEYNGRYYHVGYILYDVKYKFLHALGQTLPPPLCGHPSCVTPHHRPEQVYRFYRGPLHVPAPVQIADNQWLVEPPEGVQLYLVTALDDGALVCDCGGKYKDCWHMLEVKCKVRH